MKRLTMLVTIAGLLTLGACNKKSENPPPGPASGSMTPPPPPPVTPPPSGSAGSAAPAAGSAAVVDVPTEMDFEGEAAKKITDKNVEAQVKAIETELQQK
ncbi:MAG: hypothetical protein ABIY55_01445 [Kofleriaceae bacterium]